MGKKGFIDPTESASWSNKAFLFDLELDALNDAGRLVGRWKDTGLARQLGRRTLEVAIHQAIGAAEVRDLPDFKMQWGEGIRLATNGAKHIDEFIKFLGGRGTDPAATKAEDIAFPLNRQVRMDLYRDDARSHFNLEIEESRQEALRRAQALLDARSAALGYAAFAAENLVSLSGGKNPGEPEKLAFAETWSEAWLALTGRPAGRGSARNPFARLVTQAWEDACGEPDASFTRAIKQMEQAQLSPSTNLPTWA